MLQDNSSALADSVRVVEQFQQILQAEVSNVAQASQQAMASIEAMTVEQARVNPELDDAEFAAPPVPEPAPEEHTAEPEDEAGAADP